MPVERDIETVSTGVIVVFNDAVNRHRSCSV